MYEVKNEIQKSGLKYKSLINYVIGRASREILQTQMKHNSNNSILKKKNLLTDRHPWPMNFKQLQTWWRFPTKHKCVCVCVFEIIEI